MKGFFFLLFNNVRTDFDWLERGQLRVIEFKILKLTSETQPENVSRTENGKLSGRFISVLK